MVSTYLAIDFKFFDFVNEVKNSVAFTAQIYLITNALGGRRSVLVSPNSNMNCINVCLGYAFSRASEGGERNVFVFIG